MSNDTPWFKSTKSGGNGGSCVEVRRHNGKIEVRNTKDREGGTLVFTRDEWAAFVASTQDGEFDL
ncbi:MAG: hypothetical protein V7603_4172 [Micromonosporaceae bacterium]